MTRTAPPRLVRQLALALGLVLAVSGCSLGATGENVRPTTGAAEPSALPAVDPTPAGGAFDPAAWPLACGDTRVVDGLTDRQKLGQVLVVGVAGTADARTVAAHGVAGIFVGSGTERAILSSGAAAELRASGLPVSVAIDEEGGRVQRLRDLLGRLPSAREMAATMSADEVRARARTHGTALRGLGVTVDYAPVVDVDAGPANTVVGDRSFSGDPAVVSRYGRAFAEGLREAGVAPVVKHFPGHGRAGGDSHVGSVTTPSLADLLGTELVPFRELVAVPGMTVMVGHLTVPGLTEPGLPTSLSPATYRLLREGAGYGAPAFDGLAITDDLSGMQAVAGTYSVPEAVLLALRAGADQALWGGTGALGAVLTRLEGALASGELPRQRLDEAVRRGLEARGVVARCA